MPQTPSNPPVSDFNVDRLIQNMEGHAKDMLYLTQRVTAMENSLGDGYKIAETIKKVVKDSSSIQDIISDNFSRNLNDKKFIEAVENIVCTNAKIKEEFNKTIKSFDRNSLAALYSKCGGLIGTSLFGGVTFFLGLIVKSHWS
jgi:hypothetical protein